jgi:capsule polysaccharide export protein KpsE/RkpR
MKQALSEATANAFAKATDESHITELAQLLAAMPNDISLMTLEAYAGPENKFVADCEQQVRTTLKRQQESLEKQIQLARDLLAGTKSSQDLVNLIRLEWKQGTYARAQP